MTGVPQQRDRIHQAANLGMRVNVRDKCRRALRHFRWQRGLLQEPTADREPEQALERGMLEVPRPGDGTGASQIRSYGLEPNPGDRCSRTDGAAEGSKGLFGDDVLLPQGPAEGHIACNQIVDVHRRPSRLKSPTVRSAATLTLA